MADKINARNARGRAIRTVEKAALDQRAAAMRARSMSYDQIGAELGLSRSAAFASVQRAMRDTLDQGREEAEALRQIELDKLDYLERRLFGIIQKKHVHVTPSGKIAYLNGEPVEDDDPIVKAIDSLLRVQQRRARLLGLDRPVEVHVEAQVDFAFRALTAALAMVPKQYQEKARDAMVLALRQGESA